MTSTRLQTDFYTFVKRLLVYTFVKWPLAKRLVGETTGFLCKNCFVNWRHHAVFDEKQYVKLTLRLGWSFGKSSFVLKGIWQRLHLGRRSKPVSRVLKLPHSF